MVDAFPHLLNLFPEFIHFFLPPILVIFTFLYVIRPPSDLQALAPPATLSRLPSIPSYLSLPLLPSPTLLRVWLSLSWHLRTSPWQLRSQIVNAGDVDWAEEGSEGKEGKLLKAWGRIGFWRQEDGCLELRALKKWEALADPLADEALSSLPPHSSGNASSANDLIGRLQNASSSPEQARFSSYVICRRPSRGAGVIPLSWYAERDARRGVDTPTWLLEELQCSHEDLIPQEELQSGQDGRDAYIQRLKALAAWHDEEWQSLTDAERSEELAEETRLIELGQTVFYRYSGGILMSLLHFSLAGGFASPRLTGILRATNYLIPAERQNVAAERQAAVVEKRRVEEDKEKNVAEGEKTWKRLIETTQWVLDVMETVDTLSPPGSGIPKSESDPPSSSSPHFGGRGREATLSVRLLHSRVRSRVASKLSLPPSCLPLNQADLLATLLSFSAAPLAALSRMGLSLTLEEREAYLGLWRYIGWLMGVDDRLIRSCLLDTSRADRALWSSVVNLFSEEEVAHQVAPTLRILTSIASRPPFYTSKELHIALSTSLLGPSLSKALRLPTPSSLTKLRVALTYMGMFLTIQFSKWYLPRSRGKAWEAKRHRCSRKLLRRLIVWNLGMKRSRFQGGTGAGAGEREGEGGFEDVPRNEKAAMEDVREYKWLIREMLAVHLLVGLFLLLVAFLIVGAWCSHREG